MIALLFACIPTLEGTYTAPSFSDPEITDFIFECDPEANLWTFTLTADAWTGNALLWLRDEEGAQEEHPLISQGAPRDGSSDNLEIELVIVGDWRDVKRGKSTRWPCEKQEELSMIVEVYHPKTYDPTDCLISGPQWPEEEPPAECDQPWE